jgi:phosphoribosylformylglycinamidine synthase
LIALLGTTADDLSISEYAATIEANSTEQMIAEGSVPKIDLMVEAAVQAVCLEAAESGLLASAHDCSDGGIAVALAESCFSSLNRQAIGAAVSLDDSLPTTSALFSESPSRIIVSFPESSRAALHEMAGRYNSPFKVIGKVGGSRLRIRHAEQEPIAIDVHQLESGWRSSLSKRLEAEVMAAGME